MIATRPEGDGWKVTYYRPPDESDLWMVDITPVNDLMFHFLGDECWCNPKIVYQNDIPIITHNSRDLREKPEAPRI